MVIKINSDELRILKASLIEPLDLDRVEAFELLGIEINSDDVYYYVSGPKAALFELLYRLSFKYQIEFL